MSQTKVTGREPALASGLLEKGKQRLSLRRLGTMLNILSPDSVSLDAVREMIRSDDFAVRYNAAKMLSKRADRDARRIIEDALENAGTRTRSCQHHSRVCATRPPRRPSFFLHHQPQSEVLSIRDYRCRIFAATAAQGYP